MSQATYESGAVGMVVAVKSLLVLYWIIHEGQIILIGWLFGILERTLKTSSSETPLDIASNAGLASDVLVASTR